MLYSLVSQNTLKLGPAVPDENRFYDLFFIYHPDKVSTVRRIAAQLNAMGSVCRFEEDDLRKNALDIAELKKGVLRSHMVGIVLSPASAASQLCNELIQYAVNNSKRIVTLILDEEIEIEVHPAIADNPYVFFRERDDLAERVDELQKLLTIDHETRLHTELLVAADSWQRRGRRPSQLLPPDRVAEARQWLADGSARTLKPSPLLIEFIHNSRRQRPTDGRSVPRRRLGLLILVGFALALGFLLLRAVLESNRAARAEAVQTQAAQTQLSITYAAATAASDSALGLVDQLAATSAVIAESVNRTAQAAAHAATQAVHATETAQAAATVARATEIFAQARATDAARLVDAAETALATGDKELALALAWLAKDALDNPKPAYRVLRRAASGTGSSTLDGLSTLRFQPGGKHVAAIADAGQALRITDSATWELRAEHSDHEAPLSLLEYNPAGDRLIAATEDGEIIVRAGDSGDVIRRWPGHEGAVTAVAIHPDADRFYSAGSGPMLVAWNINSGDALATRTTSEDEGFAIDELIVTADGGRIIGWGSIDGKRAMAQWSADTLERLNADGVERVYRGYDAARRYGYSGGRSLPAYAGDPNTGDLIIWDLSSEEQITRLDEGFNWSLGDLTAPSDELIFISFYDDVALVGVESGDGGQRALLIQLADGGVMREYDGELAGSLSSAYFVDRQTILSTTGDSRLILWSLADGNIIRVIGASAQQLTGISFDSAANTVIGRAGGGRVFLWRMDKDRDDAAETLADAMPGSGISPSGDLLLLLEDSRLRLDSVQTRETTLEIDAQLVRRRGAFFAVSDGASAALYETETGQERQSWDGAWDRLRDLHLSADGASLLAVDDDGNLWLMGRESDKPLLLDAGNLPAPSKVDFSANGEYMFSLHGKRVILWELESRQALGRYALDEAATVAVDAAFGAGGDSLIVFVQLNSGLASLTALTLPDNAARRHTFINIAAGAFSRNGATLLLAMPESGIHIVDTNDGAVIYQLPKATEIPDQWRYLPEPGLLAIAVGSEVSIWDLTDGEIDQRFSQDQPVVEIDVSDNGRLVMTRDAGGVYRLWQVESPADLLRRIEAENPARELTCAERLQYLVTPLCQ